MTQLFSLSLATGALASLLFCNFAHAEAQLDVSPEVLQEWESNIEKTQTSRQKRTSFIYWDVAAAPNKTPSHRYYLTRTATGEMTNFLAKHDSLPQKFQLGESLLGTIETFTSNDDNTVQVRFVPNEAELKTQILPRGELIEVPELAIGFFLRKKDSKRSEGPYVKVFNYNRPFAESFRNPQYYPYNPDFRVHAIAKVDFESTQTKSVTMSKGNVIEETLLGYLEFELEGKKVKLGVYPDGRDYSQVRFSDLSEASYPGGRYIRVNDSDLMNPKGFTIDLNFSYDPPCANSQVYNCSLPTADEHIPLAVKAGRKWGAAGKY